MQIHLVISAELIFHRCFYFSGFLLQRGASFPSAVPTTDILDGDRHTDDQMEMYVTVIHKNLH